MEQTNGYCCDPGSDTSVTQITARLIGKKLQIVVNGAVAWVDLSSIAGSGGGEIPSEYPLPVDIVLPVSSNGQVLFSEVVPENAIVVELIVNGVVYSKGLSFTVTGGNLSWVNEAFELAIGDTVILKTWQL